MISEGRSETVLGALMSLSHLMQTLETAEQGHSGFAELLDRGDLPVSTKAALALIDQQVEDLVADMQTPKSRAAAAAAFATVPRVRIGGSGPPTGAPKRA
jgi:uncharacterized protein YgbK (DUF1537 family)